MRYTVWGPVIGLGASAILFLLGVFGVNFNSYLITGVALVLIGLIIGVIMDLKK